MHMQGEHTVALMGLLLVPVVVVCALAVVQRLGSAGSGAFGRTQRRIEASGPVVRGVSVLLLVTALMHLALVPAHLPGEDHSLTGALFLLDGLALIAAAALPFPGRSWRAPVAALLLANLLAYGVYLAAGWESADAVGVLAKIVEYTALAATCLPAASRLRRHALLPARD
jgi:hypothetical protein